MALIGHPSVDPPSWWHPVVVRVRCGDSRNELAPLIEAQRKIELRLGADPLTDEPPVDLPGLRHRLLDETRPCCEGFVEAANRLARWAQDGAVLIFEAADRADPTTIAYLSRLLLSGTVRGRLGHDDSELLLPVLLAFSGYSVPARCAQLIDAVRASGGAVLAVTPDDTPHQADEGIRRLPPTVVAVLRAGATFGTQFSVVDVARQLRMDVVDVLEALQSAADGGVALEDDGDLNIRMPASTAELLRRTTLPSLARAREVAGAVPRRPAARPVSPPTIEELQPEPPSVDTVGEEVEPPQPIPPEEPARPGPLDDESDPLVAADQAARVGAFTEALDILERALDEIGTPPDPSRRIRKIELLLAIARLHWQGAAPGADFSLDAAASAAGRAQELLLEDDPVDVRARTSVMIAHIGYDRGDQPSLQLALEELTAASRMLLEAGEPYQAARLLNDQAAVFVRAGDSVRAMHLLEQSRKVFAERADTDPVAFQEMAETDHLMARIPLHVEAKPGKEHLALEAALKSAKRAEGAFKRLSAARQLARVYETLGRLEYLANRDKESLRYLEAAVKAEQAAGDALGLARAAAAMADVFEANGQTSEALALLGESVRLNRLKGSPLGLAFNRRSLAGLRAGLSRTPKLRAAQRKVTALLEAAERELGRIGLPGERDEDVP